SDIFTGKSLPGSFVLRSWVNDLKPPTISLLTKTVASGRPTIVAIAKDAQSGVDPLSLIINYNGSILLGAAAYDRSTGIALFPIPTGAPPLKAGLKKKEMLSAADNAETKNVNPPPGPATPNTTTRAVRLNVVNRPTVDWLVPAPNECLRKTASLVVVAGSNKKLTRVTFSDGVKTIGTATADLAGLAGKARNTKNATKGTHRLMATARDAAGRTVTANRAVRVCA